MPRRDKTGPAGQGPITGRGLGDCTGSRGNYGSGFGFRHGFGRGRGYGQGFGFHHGYGYSYSAQDEKQWLENEIHSLKDQLAYFEKRLSDWNKDGNQNVEQ